jgi:hypothetical protein
LFIVEELASEWGISTDTTTTVWFEVEAGEPTAST